jgi:DNA-binding transcriptional MerR regulator
MNVSGEVSVERIIENLDKVKLKLDEAFFYLDEIEEIIEEHSMGEEADEKVSQANERLTGELSSLSARVLELQEILEALKARRDAGADAEGSQAEGPPTEA